MHAVHQIQNVIGEFTRYAVRTVLLYRRRHIGDSGAASGFGALMQNRNFFPLAATGAIDQNRASKRVRIGNADAALGAVDFDVGKVMRVDIETRDEGCNRAGMKI